MKVLLSVLALIFALFVAAGVGAIWYFSGDVFTETRDLNVPHVENSALQVVTKNGSISMRESNVDQVEIKATIKAKSEERLAACEIFAERGGAGTLEVGVRWPGGKKHMREGCAFEFKVPSGIAGVTLNSSNGRVTSDGLAGDAVIRTSNGSIDIANHDGSVSLRTSNGKIGATGITGSVVAKSSNGSIEVTLADSSPGPVNLETSNGSVKLKLGTGFTGTLKMDTSNGSIKFGGASGGQVVRSGKKTRRNPVRRIDCGLLDRDKQWLDQGGTIGGDIGGCSRD